MTYRLNDIDIRVFKLSSGEEIISLVSSTEGDKVYLEFPLQVHKRVMKDTHAFAFSDWQPLGNAQNKVTVNMTHVISHAYAEDEVKERYIRMCLQLKNHYEDNDDDDDDTTLDADQYDEFMTTIAKKQLLH